jgi:hypothetical protein
VVLDDSLRKQDGSRRYPLHWSGSPLASESNGGRDDLMSAFRGIVLQKSFFADDQNSAGRGRDFLVQDVRHLAASRKIHRRLR